MAAPATAIPEELLAEIFLRLPDPADLARVSGTCPFFRRLATDHSFLRRYRKLYPPPLLGFIDQRPAFHPASTPHPSAPAARAVAGAADFSFSFLPTPVHSWVIQDVRDGRVLLLDRERDIEEGKRAFTDLAVCDPLYRQYLLLPSVPDDLTASVEDPPTSMRWCEPFFVPPSDEEEEEEELAEGTTFRVMWMAQCVTKLAFLDFSSSTGQWRVASSKCWADLYPAAVWSDVLQGERMLLWKRNYACSCFYWVMDWREMMLELDIGKMEISITDMPPGGISRSNVIVEAGEGKRGIATIESNFDGYNHTPDLGYNGQDSNQWHMEKPIPVPSGYYCEIAHYTEKHLVIRMTKDMNQSQDFEYFSFNVKTLHMEKVCDSKEYICRPRRYTNYPPSLLSSPTVCSGKLSVAS